MLPPKPQVESPSSSVSAGGTRVLEPSQQIFLGHPVELPHGIGSLEIRGQRRHSFGLGFIHLDLFLQGLNKIFFEILRHQGGLRDLAQGDHRIFIVVAVHHCRRAGGDNPGPGTSQ